MSKVNMPRLIALGTPLSESQARSAIWHGNVYVNAKNMSGVDLMFEREKLSGALVRASRYSFRVNEDATGILRDDPRCRLLC